MANIIFRESITATIPASIAAKGAPLTNLELDGNFRSLNVNKLEISDSIFIGTTSLILNRASAAQTLTGISIDGNAATVTDGIYTTSSINIGTTSITLNRASAAQTLTGVSIDGNAGTVTNGVYTNTANIFTDTNTFRSASGIKTEQATTQDAIIVQGRGGGTGSFSVTLTPGILSANRTITFPDATGVVVHDGGSYSDPSWITSLSETKVLPSQTGQSGKYLTTNGTTTSWAAVTGGASGLDELTDVVLTSPSNGQVLKYNGTNWVNDTDATSGGGGGITTGKAIAMAIVFGG